MLVIAGEDSTPLPPLPPWNDGPAGSIRCVTRFCAPLVTPIGRLWVTVTTRGVAAITRGDLPPSDAALDPHECEAAAEQLRAYFHATLFEFDLVLDLTDASRFDAAVWSGARDIPYGATVSYGELALMAGHPGAARAVGGAMARCRLTPVVPCHRVIHADGSIGGWGGDTWVKRWLLDHEARVVTAE